MNGRVRGALGGEEPVEGARLVAYHVEASDGPIGRVDRHSEAVGDTYLVVNTGPLLLGRHGGHVLFPARLVWARTDAANAENYANRHM